MRCLDSCEAGFDWEERVHERLLACAGGKSSARLKTNPTSEPTPHPAPEPVASTSRQENQRECWICKRPAIRGTKRRPLCQQHYMKRINKEIKKKRRRRNRGTRILNEVLRPLFQKLSRTRTLFEALQ
ncbi:unnamed protein product [Bemisia tabaci]|uniref:Uncharacterized protein n=1 Tax=Bemisia tabaci TaxID=7038 RepID=A0A9P0A339_BEMTA|nr:unnamed protein product [Bemisia tabaci]